MDLSGRTVLVVDDVRFTRATLLKMLQQFGEPTLREAGDGAQALALLQEPGASFDLVITDLEMPDLDGIGLLKEIRSGQTALPNSLPVILLTGHSELDRMGPALLLDLDAFIPKPTSKQALQSCIEHVLDDDHPARSVLSSPEHYRAIDIESGSLLGIGAAAEKDGMEERPVAIKDLPDTSILSRDLLFANGRLLLSAGTTLNRRIAMRLAELSTLSTLNEPAWIYA